VTQSNLAADDLSGCRFRIGRQFRFGLSETWEANAAMNRLSHDEPYENGNSICGELMVRAERELSVFVSAVAELFGPEQATLAAKDWLQQLEVMTDLPRSTRDWRLMSIEASARLAKRVNTYECTASS
jgi:hypothetical protein